jgi:hypothetical protein
MELLLIVGAYFLHRAFNLTMLTMTFVFTAIGSMGVDIFTKDAGAIHNIATLFFFLFNGLPAIFAVACSYNTGTDRA